jgi:4-hydroxybenzoate polyprenyltransferase
MALAMGIITFFAFSFAASSIYCFNDIHDVADDRRHSAKCHRPIASGAVSVPQAYGLMMLMFGLSMALCAGMALLLPAPVVSGEAAPLPSALKAGGVILFYWLLNLAYCAKLKQYAIIDVCIVAFGFVLRLLAGGLVTGIVLSKWLVLMTFLLTLFMSFAKRRDDVLRMERRSRPTRRNPAATK